MDEPRKLYDGPMLNNPIAYIDHGPWAGWLFAKHPDGQWVSICRFYPDELTDVEKNRIDHPAMMKMAEDHLEETEKLAAQLNTERARRERAEAMCRELEWAGSEADDSSVYAWAVCPECGRTPKEGHVSGCELGEICKGEK